MLCRCGQATTHRPGSLFGKRVQLHGLSGRPELNGSAGCVTSWDYVARRYTVRLDNNAGELSVSERRVVEEGSCTNACIVVDELKDPQEPSPLGELAAGSSVFLDSAGKPRCDEFGYDPYGNPIWNVVPRWTVQLDQREGCFSRDVPSKSAMNDTWEARGPHTSHDAAPSATATKTLFKSLPHDSARHGTVEKALQQITPTSMDGARCFGESEVASQKREILGSFLDSACCEQVIKVRHHDNTETSSNDAPASPDMVSSDGASEKSVEAFVSRAPRFKLTLPNGRNNNRESHGLHTSNMATQKRPRRG